ncbi:MAG: acireductone dioxygenase [Bradymonadaceae bacterium]
MTTLWTFSADNPDTPEQTLEDGAKIKRLLESKGVRFERWETRDLPADAEQDEILEAYEPEVERLKDEGGFENADVISLNPDNPKKDELRQKFLDEHRHTEDEVRFFVRGQGLFYLHLDDEIYAVMCCKNDLISVPTGTPHWFDMGPQPEFTCIRLFTTPDGWEAHHTGADIASRTPRYEALEGAR